MWSRPQGFQNCGMYLHEGINKQRSEALHLALALQELGENSLDAFLRQLLTHLTFFRGMVDHPGFDWSLNLLYVGTKLTHLATVCYESDPELRKQKLENYSKEIKDEFEKMNSTNQVK